MDEEVSIGDYVLSGGELPALVVLDAVARFVPGVVGDERSVAEDSFSRGLLDFPHYTRPAEVGADRVPDVLLSGNHAEIRRWRKRESLARTLARRPELLKTAALDEEERDIRGAEPQKGLRLLPRGRRPGHVPEHATADHSVPCGYGARSVHGQTEDGRIAKDPHQRRRMGELG